MTDPPAQRDRFYYKADDSVKNAVNTAIRLRRPILVTGPAGVGKTSLAESIARELGLGPVLTWLITSRSTLREGLYDYDVFGRINDMNLYERLAARASRAVEELPMEAAELPQEGEALREAEAQWKDASDIGRYITLGPLGDALLPRQRPRVLLIDEIDKCDIDLPGDLLHVFERGWYEIPELVRERAPQATVQRAGGYQAVVRGGRVECREFPVIVLTSNEEREFAPAFRRRCLQLHLTPPEDRNVLEEIAREKLKEELAQSVGLEPESVLEGLLAGEVGDFIRMRGKEGVLLATDQLLSALYLRLPAQGLPPEAYQAARKIIYTGLGDLADG